MTSRNQLHDFTIFYTFQTSLQFSDAIFKSRWPCLPVRPLLLYLQQVHTLLGAQQAQHSHTQNIAGNRLKMTVVVWKANYRYHSSGASAAPVVFQMA